MLLTKLRDFLTYIDTKYFNNLVRKIHRNYYKSYVFTRNLGSENKKIFALCRKSYAQLFQDVFVLSKTNFKKNGFFVEFGATDGIHHSNTYLLESEFSWTGILAEPGKTWHENLYSNRTSKISEKLVWSSSGKQVKFLETSDPALSTCDGFESRDFQHKARSIVREYKVETISLNDLLVLHSAPNHIDFLSVDTEGSEFEVLNNLNFSKYSFQVIAVEHNYTPNRDKILRLLTANGYTRVNENLSLYDDWFVKL